MKQAVLGIALAAALAGVAPCAAAQVRGIPVYNAGIPRGITARPTHRDVLGRMEERAIKLPDLFARRGVDRERNGLGVEQASRQQKQAQAERGTTHRGLMTGPNDPANAQIVRFS